MSKLDPSFASPSRWSASAKHLQELQAQEKTPAFTGAETLSEGGRFSAMRNNLIQSAAAQPDAVAEKPTKKPAASSRWLHMTLRP